MSGVSRREFVGGAVAVAAAVTAVGRSASALASTAATRTTGRAFRDEVVRLVGAYHDCTFVGCEVTITHGCSADHCVIHRCRVLCEGDACLSMDGGCMISSSVLDFPASQASVLVEDYADDTEDL